VRPLGAHLRAVAHRVGGLRVMRVEVLDDRVGAVDDGLPSTSVGIERKPVAASIASRSSRSSGTVRATQSTSSSVRRSLTRWE
jgi:hypothetical protein